MFNCPSYNTSWFINTRDLVSNLLFFPLLFGYFDGKATFYIPPAGDFD